MATTHPIENAAEVVRQNTRIAALELQVDQLKSEVSRLSRSRSADCDAISGPDFAEVLRITQDMFPESTPEVELAVDPENPDEPFVVVTVRCSEEIDKIVEKKLAWHDRISGLAADNSCLIRLSVIPD